jgi:hypothetical protein
MSFPFAFAGFLTDKSLIFVMTDNNLRVRSFEQ